MVKGKTSATHLRDEAVKRNTQSNKSTNKKSAPVFGEGVKLAAIQHPHLKKVAAKTEPEQSDDHSNQQSIASIIDLDDDSEHFVRGRASVPKSSTHRDTDNLFTSHKRKAESTDKSINQGKSKKTKTKPVSTEDAEAAELIAKATGDNDDEQTVDQILKPASIGDRKISVLKSRLMTPGFTLVGSIDRLMDLEAIVSLPNGHVGHLALREVSEHVSAAVDAFLESNDKPKSNKSKQSVASLPKLSDYLRVGDVWPFAVLSSVSPTGANRIELTLKSQAINQSITSSMLADGVQLMGTVHSIEEKGYTIELGVSDSSIKGFLPFKEAPVAEIRNRSVDQSNQSIKAEEVAEDAQFEVGQPIICRVTKLSSRMISLTARPEVVMQSGASISATQNFSSLLPGALYPLTVDAADLNGYHCSCASFTASVDVLHMPTVPPQPIALKQAIKAGTQVLGRLLYADKRLKVLSFTLHPRVVKEGRGMIGAPIALGDYVEARVHRVEGNAGVWFRCKKITREAALKRFHAFQAAKEKKAKSAKKSKKQSKGDAMEDESDAEKESDDEETTEESVKDSDANSDDDVVETDDGNTDGPEWMLGYCKGKWLDDVAVTKVPRKFPFAAVRVARVTSVDSFDSIVQLSLQSNQIEKKIVSIADVTEGEFVEGTIASIESFGILVQLAPALKGLIPLMHLADISINQTIKSIPKRFRVGKTVKARVLTVDGKGKRIIMTVKPSMMTTHDSPVTTYEEITSNQLLTGFITAAEPYGLIVQFYGHVHGLVSVKTLIKEGLIDPEQQSPEKAIRETWNKGDSIRVRVANVQADKRKLYLSLKLKVDESKRTKVKVEKAQEEESSIKLEAGSVGSIIEGKVQKVMPGMGLLISANDHTVGVVNITNVADHWTNQSLSKFTVNQSVRVKVLDVSSQPDGKKKVNLSMRSSDLVKAGPSSRSTMSLSDFVPGSLVMGIVKRTDPKGCFVWLTDSIIGRILIKDLSDRHVADPVASFPPGELVRARVVSVDTENQSISLSMRRSADSRVKFEDLTVGAKVKGEVKAIKPFGLFVRLSHSQLDGLAHISECIEQPAKSSKDSQSADELASHYKVGDRVRAVVLKLDPTTKKISLAVKASHFADETEEERAAAEVDSDDDEEPVNQSFNPSSISSEELLKSPVPSFNSPVIAGVKAQSATGQAVRELMEDFDAAPALDLNALDEDVSMEQSDDNSSTAETAAPATKLSQAARRSEVEQREHALVNPAMKPQTVADYDRLILAQPNSSMNYIQLMAHHIDAGAIDQARAVGEKALVAIDYREDKERLNVWLALVGLERTHGTAQSTTATIEKAIQRSDERAVLAAVAEMFGASGDVDSAVKFYQRLVKEYPDDKNTWLQFARFMYGAGRVDTARALLVSCLAKLHASHHIEVMERFAKLEASHIKQGGSIERARTMLEQLMHQHPKRLDLINVFIDLETTYLNSFTPSDKARAVAAAHLRTLFERVTSRAWSSKKMKFLLKRNLEFEQQFGDAKKIEAVKDKARKYVESKGATKEDDEE